MTDNYVVFNINVLASEFTVKDALILTAFVHNVVPNVNRLANVIAHIAADTLLVLFDASYLLVHFREPVLRAVGRGQAVNVSGLGTQYAI